MKNVVVLGGSGFVGRYVVNELTAQEEPVIVPTRWREGAKHLIVLPTVDVVEADVHDPAALVALCADAWAVINLVGILHGDFQRVHVELARKLISACQTAGVKRLLHLSALNASKEGPSRYLRSKGEAEEMVAASGLNWTIFRPSVIFGREDRFLNLFAQLQSIFPVMLLGCADARFQPVFVEDVARAVAHSLRDETTFGQRYQLCGPKVYRLRELVQYAGEVTGRRRPIAPLPHVLAELQAAVLEHLPGRLMTRDNIASMQVDNVCDCPFPAAFGGRPVPLETIVPTYLGPAASRDRYAEYRTRH